MTKKPERNDPCPCGSGKKFKKCCAAKGKEKVLRSSRVSVISSGTSGVVNSLFQKNVTASPPPQPKDEEPDKLL